MRLGLYIITLLLLSIMAAAAFTLPISTLRKQRKKLNAQLRRAKTSLPPPSGL